MKPIKYGSIRILVLVCVCTVGFFYYYPLKFNSLMGDDLVALFSLLNRPNQGLFDRLFLHDLNGVYRPIGQIHMFVRAQMFWTDYNLYFFSNLLMLFINASILFVLIEKITDKDWRIAGALVMFYTLHRFQNYCILNCFGGEELFIQFIFILLVSALFKYSTNPTRLGGFLVLFCYTLSVFTRENLVFAAPGFAIAFLLIRPTREQQLSSSTPSNRGRYLMSVGIIAIAMLYVIIRHLILGGGSTKIPGAEIRFDPLNNIRSYIIFFLNNFQLLLNEEHFSGIRFADVPFWVKTAVILLTVGSIIAITSAIWKNWFVKNEKMFVLTLILVGAGLILPASLIVKNDPKYIELCFICYVIVFAYSFHRLHLSQTVQWGLSVLFLMSVLFTCFFYRSNIEALFYVYSNRISDNLKQETLDRHGFSLKKYSIYISENNILDYPLQKNNLFRVYLKDPSYEVHYYKSLKEIHSDEASALIYSFDWPSRTFQDVKDQWIYMKAEIGDLNYDFCDNLEREANYSHRETTDNPWHSCVAKDYFTIMNEKREGIIAIPNSRISYAIHIPDTIVTLSFGVGLYEKSWDWGGDGLRYQVLISGGKNENIIYDRYMDPSHVPSDRKWCDTSLDLSNYANQNVTISFITKNDSGKTETADWAIWSDPILGHENPLSAFKKKQQ